MSKGLSLQDFSTLHRSNSSSLLIVTTGAGTGITSTTLARWTKVIMTKSGIDTNYFKPYSTRAAATSNEAKKTGSLLSVFKMGSWKKSSTFFNFYLCKVKYFSRLDGNTKEDYPLASANNVPASPLRKRANFTITRSKDRLRKRG